MTCLVADTRLRLALSAFVLLLLSVWSAHAAQPVAIGDSVVALNGPWKFHTGDDPRWADPDFDDSSWANMDLTPAPGAHDADVGLKGYVPGWTARGYPHYAGYAWYRLSVIVDAPQVADLALTGPADVDSAYQLYVNGHLIGAAGNFSGVRPVAYGIQPRLFDLPSSLWRARPDGKRFAVIAFRVWMGKHALSFNTFRGGIQIAPQLGSSEGAAARYRLQWLQTFEGYVVDATEAVVFLLLAAMAFNLRAFDRADSSYVWLSAALVLTAVLRANQPAYFWGQFESALQYFLMRQAILDPLTLFAWLMMWWTWLSLARPGWIPAAATGLTAIYVLAELAVGSALETDHLHIFIGPAQTVAAYVRLAFAAGFLWIAYRGIALRAGEALIAMPAMILVMIGLFAPELGELHVPGIWIPFGVGVSRTEYAYAAFDVALYFLLRRRLLQFANAPARS